VANGRNFVGRHWDGNTYIDDNEQGERWAVSFGLEGAVAVFYSQDSERNPYLSNKPPYDQSGFFREMPDKLISIKESALSWMFDLEWKVSGPAAITAAMWADSEQFTSNEPWDVVFRHSGWACYQQLLPLDVAIAEWQNEYQLAEEDMAVVHSIYTRRISATDLPISLLPLEEMAFKRQGINKHFADVQNALAVVGISLLSYDNEVEPTAAPSGDEVA
jgi:hypothetical protein